MQRWPNNTTQVGLHTTLRLDRSLWHLVCRVETRYRTARNAGQKVDGHGAGRLTHSAAFNWNAVPLSPKILLARGSEAMTAANILRDDIVMVAGDWDV